MATDAQEPTWLPALLKSMRSTHEAHMAALDHILELERALNIAADLVEELGTPPNALVDQWRALTRSSAAPAQEETDGE